MGAAGCGKSSLIRQFISAPADFDEAHRCEDTLSTIKAIKESDPKRKDTTRYLQMNEISRQDFDSPELLYRTDLILLLFEANSPE